MKCLLCSMLHFGYELHTVLLYFVLTKDQNETEPPQEA